MVKRILILKILLLILTLSIFIFGVTILTYAEHSDELDSQQSLINKRHVGFIIADRDGKPFFQFNQASITKYVSLSDISPNIINAIVASEDKDFYTHPGFSVSAMTAAVVANLKHKDRLYGGSTITQQFVKNSLLKNDKSFFRKYQEILLASEMERKYSKQQILEMYLNTVYFGQGAFGVEAASDSYFNKSAKDLNLSEATILAALLPAPTLLSSSKGGNQDALKNRQGVVLSRLAENGYISSEEKQEILNQNLDFASSHPLINYQAPHFALMVRDKLIEMYSEDVVNQSGFTVKTTIDLDYQTKAEKIVAEQVEKLKRNRASNASVVIIDPKTGEVLALVGSKDWDDDNFGKVNMATAPRQSGSSFKPIVYAAALEKKLITPATILKDQPTIFLKNVAFTKPYSPKNYDGKFRGDVLPRRALSNSLNVPAVAVMEKIGVEGALNFARSMGISSLGDANNYGLSLVLGTGEVSLLELTSAYSVFANEGKHQSPEIILEIKDKYGKVVYAKSPKSEQVLSPQTAFQISSILSDSRTRSEVFGKLLDTSKTAAVKTGTTEDYKDALTIGYTPNLVIGVWVGNNDNKAMDQVAGSLGAAPIWKSLIDTIAQGNDGFSAPEGLVLLSFCSQPEYFVSGTQPSQNCTLPKKEPEKSPNPSGSPAPLVSPNPIIELKPEIKIVDISKQDDNGKSKSD